MSWRVLRCSPAPGDRRHHLRVGGRFPWRQSRPGPQDPARAGLFPNEASELVGVHFSSFVGSDRLLGHAAERADSSLDSMVPTTLAKSASKAARPSSSSWAVTVS